MYLRSIELHGFKSFAKKSVLEFTSSISAIVGPNGSGKSNIAEAFRFVLGEQSIKSLRGKKGEDLIFNGTTDLSKMNVAKVRLVFDNTNRVLPIDYDEVTIERAVHRDGVNEYSINNSLVRLKDIVELLASAHIGSSGHHIISQGEADRILSASARERKAMIQDALGLRLIEYRLLDSQRKLEKTKENLDKAYSLEREISPQIRFLKKQVEKIEKSAELRAELLALSLTYLATEKVYIAYKKNVLDEEGKSLDTEKRRVEEEFRAAEAVMKQGVYVSADIPEYKRKLEAITLEKEKTMRELGGIEGEIKSLLSLIRKQKDVYTQIEHKQVPLVKVKEVFDTLEQEISKVEADPQLDTLLSLCIFVRETMGVFMDTHREAIDFSLLSKTEEEVSILEERRLRLQKTLDDFSHVYREYQILLEEEEQKVEDEKEKNHQAEKNYVALESLKTLLRDRQEILHQERLHVSRTEEEYMRDIQELSVLLGHEVLQFQSMSAVDATRTHQEETKRKIERLKLRLEDSGNKSSEDDVLREYEDLCSRHDFLQKEIADLESGALSLKELIKDLTSQMTVQFTSGLEKINTEFQKFFTTMFGGGEAQLSVVVAEQTEEETRSSVQEEMGIEIDVSLPRKKVQGLLMLSGGERALTSIALLFAISGVNPPPFIILDETDAALDEANSKKYGDMIEELAKHSQLIVITHNRETMSRAGILYGVTSGSTGSKLLSVAFEEAVKVAK